MSNSDVVVVQKKYSNGTVVPVRVFHNFETVETWLEGKKQAHDTKERDGETWFVNHKDIHHPQFFQWQVDDVPLA